MPLAVNEISPWIIGTVAAIAAWVAFRWLRRRIGRAIGNYFVAKAQANAPRSQYIAFVLRLRDLLFKDPVTFMGMLWSSDRDAFVRRLWVEVGQMVARATHTQDAATGDALSVKRMQLEDGRALAVIKLPEPEHWGETYFVGVVLPWDERLKGDVNAARKFLRYFVLNRFGSDGTRETDLCEWTTVKGKPRLLTYNVGGGRDAVRFAEAVGAKLRELRR